MSTITDCLWPEDISSTENVTTEINYVPSIKLYIRKPAPCPGECNNWPLCLMARYRPAAYLELGQCASVQGLQKQ